MKIVPELQQRTPEWHAFRAEGIGGSEIAAVLGVSPYKTALACYLEKTGAVDAPDLSRNPHVQRGVRFEEHVSQIVQQHIGEKGEAVCGIHPDKSHLRASFDLVTPSYFVEIKCPSDKQWDAMIANGPHPWYVVQAQYQGVVAEKLGLKGKLAYWRQCENPDGSLREEVRIFDVEVDSEAREMIVSAADDFWRRIQKLDPPPPDPVRDTLTLTEMSQSQIREWETLAERIKAREVVYDRLKAEMKVLDAASEADEKALETLLGGRCSGNGFGIQYTRYWAAGAVDYAKVLAKFAPQVEKATLDTFRKKGSWRGKLTVTK